MLYCKVEHTYSSEKKNNVVALLALAIRPKYDRKGQLRFFLIDLSGLLTVTSDVKLNIKSEISIDNSDCNNPGRELKLSDQMLITFRILICCSV